MTLPHNATPRRGGRAGWIVLFVALAVLVAGLVVSATSARTWSDARSESQERTAVIRVAEQFTAEVNNYDADSIDQYRDTVGELLTTKFRAEFDQAMEDIVTQVDEAKMTSQGEILVSGVSSIDPDSAEVLVVADAAVTTVFDQLNRHFRWKITLAKVDGDWLVDDFVPVQ
ncbi:hypothetical protein J2S59_001799 [Nocardioides massiliensis]|uniref:Mce-associated membrane protein n=1 Tax=Nocardioides massiliensis TaxID=1325935 RepID=A0ABT9NQ72_9ACTN|nr:hypothetical protein [Nocardioides massiliensis]MDP9821990.1 hypothetical protein [Nocardioides massiliensis]